MNKNIIIFKDGEQPKVFTDNFQYMWEVDYLKNNSIDALCFADQCVGDSFARAKEFIAKNHPELLL
jgi:hypothetical protein